jgi:HEAT repeat protein
MTQLAKCPADVSGHDPAVTDWLAALSHDSPFSRPQAVSVPAAGTPPAAPLSALPGLLSLLRDDDRDVRARAAAGLGALGEQIRRALPVLRAALKEAALGDDDEAVRAGAARALLQAGPQAASEVAALVDSLHDELDVVRFHAAVALGELGRAGRPAVAALTHTHLWDEDPAVRVAAAIALWKIDGRHAVVLAALVRALGEDNELVCWLAADCLGQIGAPAREAVPALRKAQQRPFKIRLIRTAVTLALRRLESPLVASQTEAP